MGLVWSRARHLLVSNSGFEEEQGSSGSRRRTKGMRSSIPTGSSCSTTGPAPQRRGRRDLLTAHPSGRGCPRAGRHLARRRDRRGQLSSALRSPRTERPAARCTDLRATIRWAMVHEPTTRFPSGSRRRGSPTSCRRRDRGRPRSTTAPTPGPPQRGTVADRRWARRRHRPPPVRSVQSRDDWQGAEGPPRRRADRGRRIPTRTRARGRRLAAARPRERAFTATTGRSGSAER